MDENVKEVRTHRVGSITLGSALVLFGILFLVHLFVPVLTYEIIFHIWPCIFILLGIEILLANRKKNVEFVYDGKAVFLTITINLLCHADGRSRCGNSAGRYLHAPLRMRF